LDYSHEPQVTQPHLRPQEGAIGANITTHSTIPFHTMPPLCQFPITHTPFTTTQANGHKNKRGQRPIYRITFECSLSNGYNLYQLWLLVTIIWYTRFV
jgi:hypothetical protein